MQRAYNDLLRKKNAKGLILNQKGTRMEKIEMDWNIMTIYKSLANFSKIPKQWRCSFKCE